MIDGIFAISSKFIEFVSVNSSGIIIFMSLFTAIFAAYATHTAPITAAELSERLRAASVERDLQFDCLRRMIAYRSMPPRDEWLAVIQEIPVTFNKYPDVSTTYRKFMKTIIESGGHDSDELVCLINAMAKVVGIDTSMLDRELILVCLLKQKIYTII